MRPLLLLLLASLAALTMRADDLDLVRSRLEAAWLASANFTEAERWLTTQKADGSWPDIDSEDKRGTTWPLAEHMPRVQTLAKAYRAENSPLRGSSEVRQAIGRALEYWYQRDFINLNWWHNEIGVPRNLAPALLLIRDELTPRELEQGVRILSRSEIKAESQNLVWLAEINAYRGLLTNDAALVARAYGRIAAEIRIVESEGLQADFSLLQHRLCLYSHGYGTSFIDDCARLAALLHGTRFSLAPEQLQLLVGMMLDGNQWMSRGLMRDWSARGREIARRGLAQTHYLARAAETLLPLQTGREVELRGLIARIRNPETSTPLVGNRIFWRSDFITHHRPEYYLSVRAFSSRIANTDFNGPENLFAHHLADGATVIAQRGDEFDGIFPLWDWQKIPGITARQEPPLQPATARRDRGSRPFAGGVSNGSYGIFAFDFERDGLEARKAWFCFDRGFLALGSGINDQSGAPIATVLDQRFAKGEVIRGPLGVWHDGIAYLALAGPEVSAGSESRRSSWRRINQGQPDDPVEGEVFTALMDHGRNPIGGTYAYFVQPGVSKEQLPGLRERLGVRVIVNSPPVQAAWDNEAEVGGAVFYAAGEVELVPGVRLRVDRPAAVLVRREGSLWRMWVSSPAHESGRLEITWRGAPVRLNLPSGQQAGSSVEVPL
jgi:chondroitin AC lyase